MHHRDLAIATIAVVDAAHLIRKVSSATSQHNWPQSLADLKLAKVCDTIFPVLL